MKTPKKWNISTALSNTNDRHYLTTNMKTEHSQSKN